MVAVGLLSDRETKDALNIAGESQEGGNRGYLHLSKITYKEANKKKSYKLIIFICC